MVSDSLHGSISINLGLIARITNILLPILTVVFTILAYYEDHQSYYLIAALLFFLVFLNFFYRHVQKKHTLLKNYGIIAQLRYLMESIGPEFRQYLYMSDTEEDPFNRIERSEIYRKAKGMNSSAAFGSQLPFRPDEMKLLHSMYPLDQNELIPYELQVGEERQISQIYTLEKPILISGMSFGALGQNAVRALARGAKRAGIAMNTGEGGYPKYHLMEGCDLIFQIGTAKFGVRNDDGSLNPDRLQGIASKAEVKMIEIKLSQGAKPGKGGILPKEKITEEIAELRCVPLGRDVISPPHHKECIDAKSTVAFIRRIQEISELPTGIKLCLGRSDEFHELIKEMKKQNIFPDYLSIDGAEGGTGAAPKTFIDDVGLPLFTALPIIRQILIEEQITDKFKIFCAGKLINAGSQFMALASGADAIYTARGFLLAIGCIQAMQCHRNVCPTGITTHDKKLQRGLDIEDKAIRVVNYVHSLSKEHTELLMAMGQKTTKDLNTNHISM